MVMAAEVVIVAAEKQGDADDVAVMTNDEGIRGHVVFVTSTVIITTIILVIVIFIDYCVWLLL